jgi:hypothetical protein
MATVGGDVAFPVFASKSRELIADVFWTVSNRKQKGQANPKAYSENGRCAHVIVEFVGSGDYVLST